MTILINKYTTFIYEAGEVEKGIFPEADPKTELYKVTNENGNFYAVASGFTPYEVDKLPTEHDYHNYSYTPEEGFVYHEPPKTEEQIQQDIQQQITDLQLAITELYESML